MPFNKKGCILQMFNANQTRRDTPHGNSDRQDVATSSHLKQLVERGKE